MNALLFSLVGCTSSLYVDEVTPEGVVVVDGALRVTVPAGALPVGTRLWLEDGGPTPDDVEALSRSWAIQPVGSLLAVPAEISIQLPPGATDGQVYLGDGFAFDPLDTRVEAGVAIASSSTFGVVFLGSDLEPVEPPPPTPPLVIVGPGPQPPAPVGPTPVPGLTFACWTGEDFDLAAFDDTASPAPTAATCPPGVGARIGEVLYADLHGAIAAAEPGQTLEVCPGVHIGPFARLADDVTVEGIAPEREATVLTGRLQGHVLQGWGLTVRRLTIRRGLDGAVHALGGLTAEDAVIEESFTCSYGAGVLASGPTVVSDCLIVDNLADAGAGLWHDGSASASGSLRVSGTTFRGNRARNNGGGAAVTAAGSLARIEASTFIDNHASSGDGGGFVSGVWHGGTIEIVDTSFTDNTARYTGGAVRHMAYGSGALMVEGSTFEGNTAEGSGGAMGIRLFTANNALSILDSSFVGNVAPSGAAIDVVASLYGSSTPIALDGVDLDQADACALNVYVPASTTPATLVLTSMTLVGDEPICLENATATLDGQPYAPTGPP
ncbi:MAG: right-handed parallel beta-helix repeat-containing protein [Myxococcales bacterium]|nr:right-handed parallel beta-helix repeat-containing protein [Myxococcales bacterium]